jgi:NADP-dependent 3-hydroxy acid dehydrogenase YdfG
MVGRTALVSGGASGIGRATVQALTAAGCRVLVADLDRPDALPSGADFQPVDVSKPEPVDALFERVQATWHSLDILIVNAGVGIHERLAEGDPAKWSRVFEVNVMGALRLVRAFVPAMLQSGGDVVMVSSVAARKPYPWGGVYAASKAALDVIAETLRLEVQPRVRVTTVAPGMVDTAFFAHMMSGSRDGDGIGLDSIGADQVAESILYAISRPYGVALNYLTIRPRGQPF